MQKREETKPSEPDLVQVLRDNAWASATLWAVLAAAAARAAACEPGSLDND
jgi:hypothetical protein